MNNTVIKDECKKVVLPNSYVKLQYPFMRLPDDYSNPFYKNLSGRQIMIRGIDSVLLFSKDPKNLADFYKQKVGLEVELVGEYGNNFEEKIFGVKAGDSNLLSILHHSKLKGPNKEPERFMINFEVDNIEESVSKLEKNGVKKIQEIYHVEDYGKIATFEDPDKNYFQMVQVRS